MSHESQGGFKPVLPSDFYTIEQVGNLLHINKNTVYRLSKRAEDPLPARRLGCKTRGLFVVRDELIEWALRNSELWGGRTP